MAEDIFAVINLLIALCYVLLAFYFAKRIKFPPKPERSMPAILAVIGATIFFIGCAHTHIDLFIWAADERTKLNDHWFTWWNILSHFLQAVGGLAFWVLATFFLEIKIFDKRHFNRVTGSK